VLFLFICEEVGMLVQLLKKQRQAVKVVKAALCNAGCADCSVSIRACCSGGVRSYCVCSTGFDAVTSASLIAAVSGAVQRIKQPEKIVGVRHFKFGATPHQRINLH
jgi:hypothetical protein